MLVDLAERFPEKADVRHMHGAVVSDLAYLEGHGLLEVRWFSRFLSSHPVTARITSKGLDFLQDDGGLGAILGVVTVKLHEDAVKQLLLSRIDQSTADASVKQRLADKVKDLPAETLSTVSGKLIEKGIDSAGDIVGFLAGLLR
jgi:hypothetical protein